MRKIPVDTRALKFLAQKVEGRAANAYKDGENVGQRTDEATGLPVFTVQLLVQDDDGLEPIAVKVPAREAPSFEVLEPVTVEGLVGSPYVAGGRAAVSYTAAAIRSAKAATTSQPKS